MHNNKGLPQD